MARWLACTSSSRWSSWPARPPAAASAPRPSAWATSSRSKASAELLETSYQPGLVPVRMDEVLGAALAARLRQGFENFGRKIPGYATNAAQIVGVESRTSSPVRIPRDKDSLQHPVVAGLFPCGEGAGYAGGIVSAAMDGERCAEAVAALVTR
jgi:uncharacterized FAD-dependent dehydrogenase